MWQSKRSRTAVIGSAFAIFVVCSVLPIAYLLAMTVASRAGYSSVVLDSRQRGLLFNTAALGAGTAVLATIIGSPLGIALARVSLRGKSFLRLMAAVPVLLPPYVTALGWVYSGGAHSLPAAILVLSFIYYPVSMFATEIAMRQIDGRLEEAALVFAPPGRVLWRISLPLIARSVLAAALIIFVLAVSEFGVPGLLQVRVYTTEVFTAFAALYDFSRAMLLALPLLALCVIVAALAVIALGDRLVTTRRTVGVAPVAFDRWRRRSAMAIFLVIAVAVGLPAAVLGREALAVRSLSRALSGSGEAIANSVMLSAAGATAVVAVALWLGYAVARGGPRFGRALQILFVVLFAVPSTIVGVALIGLWNRPETAAVYGTDAMFLLAYLARFVPVAALVLTANAAAVPVSHEEAASVSGAGWLRTMRGIVLPQMRLGIAGAWVVAFVLAFGELGVSILVAPPGEATLPIRIYTIIANTSPSQVAALALLQSFVIFVPLAALTAVVALRSR
jgi:iron(III) transport system permease protein